MPAEAARRAAPSPPRAKRRPRALHLQGVVLAAWLAFGHLAGARSAGGGEPAGDAPRAERPLSLVVLHTNDVHGGLLPRSPALAGVVSRHDVGGYAALAAFVRREREAAAAAGAVTLLLDGGDVWRGTPEGDLTRGDLPVEALGRLRYDAVAFGNHEFDLGVENAARLARAAAFPWVSANVTEAATGKAPPWLKPWVVVDAGGVRVAIVGLSPPETPRLVMGGDALPLRFGPVREAAAAAARALEKDADVVLFLTHLGPERDVEVLEAVPRCRLVVGGHSHARLAKPVLAGPAKASWIVQAGTGCVVAGRVRMRVDRRTHEVTLDDYTLFPLTVEQVGEDPVEKAFLAARTTAVPALAALSAPIGRLSAELSRTGTAPGDSSPAGNLVADAMRAAVPGADVALANRGGLRVSLPKGPVTGRDLHLFMPFDDALVVVEATGARLRAVVTQSLRGDRATPLEVSGLSARYRTEGEGRETRVVFASFEVGGKPLEEAKTYRVVVNSFLAQGGDGYGSLKELPRKDTGLEVREAIRAWFAAHPLAEPDPTARLRRD